MTLRRLKSVEGKTIATAECGGSDFASCDNRTLQLSFTDGSTFCLNVENSMQTEAVLYSDQSDKAKRKVIAKY